MIPSVVHTFSHAKYECAHGVATAKRNGDLERLLHGTKRKTMASMLQHWQNLDCPKLPLVVASCQERGVKGKEYKVTKTLR